MVNISPIALNATFAENELIRKTNGFNYGIEDPDKTSKYEGGSSIQIDFDRTFGKTGFLRYRTTLYSFYGWITDIGQKNKISDYSEYRIAYDDWVEKGSDIKTKPRLPIHPIVRWENTIDIKATKYLSTSLSFQLYYNRAQNLDVQTRTLLSVGLTYTFKNKEKPQNSPAAGRRMTRKCIRTRNTPSSSRCCWQRVLCWGCCWGSTWAATAPLRRSRACSARWHCPPTS